MGVPHFEMVKSRAGVLNSAYFCIWPLFNWTAVLKLFWNCWKSSPFSRWITGGKNLFALLTRLLSFSTLPPWLQPVVQIQPTSSITAVLSLQVVKTTLTTIPESLSCLLPNPEAPPVLFCTSSLTWLFSLGNTVMFAWSDDVRACGTTHCLSSYFLYDVFFLSSVCKNDIWYKLRGLLRQKRVIKKEVSI